MYAKIYDRECPTVKRLIKCDPSSVRMTYGGNLISLRDEWDNTYCKYCGAKMMLTDITENGETYECISCKGGR